MVDINNAVEIGLKGNVLAVQLPWEEVPGVERVVILCRKKHNHYFRLRMAPPKKIRTTGEKSQNHHLNGHIQQICVETGNRFEDVKIAVKMLAVDMGYPFRTVGKKIVPYSETEADTKQCAILIEAAHLIAAEENITLREKKAKGVD